MKAQYHTDKEEDNQLDEVSHAQTLPQIHGAISDVPSNPPMNNHVLDAEPQVVHDTTMHTPKMMTYVFLSHLPIRSHQRRTSKLLGDPLDIAASLRNSVISCCIDLIYIAVQY